MHIETQVAQIIESDTWNVASYIADKTGIVSGVANSCAMSMDTSGNLTIDTGLVIMNGKSIIIDTPITISGLSATTAYSIFINIDTSYGVYGVAYATSQISNDNVLTYGDLFTKTINPTNPDGSTNSDNYFIKIGNMSSSGAFSYNIITVDIDSGSTKSLTSKNIDDIFPVGIVVAYAASGMNPNNIYPGSTWVQLAGGYKLLTANYTDSNLGNTVGSAISLNTITRTTSGTSVGWPAHTHAIGGHSHSINSHNHNVTASHSHTFGSSRSTVMAAGTLTVNTSVGTGGSVVYLYNTSSFTTSKGGNTGSTGVTTSSAGGGNSSTNSIQLSTVGASSATAHTHGYQEYKIALNFWKRTA